MDAYFPKIAGNVSGWMLFEDLFSRVYNRYIGSVYRNRIQRRIPDPFYYQSNTHSVTQHELGELVEKVR